MTKTQTKESEKHKKKSQKPTESDKRSGLGTDQSDIAQPIDIPLANNT